jgi:predicted nucleic acid-binding protein
MPALRIFLDANVLVTVLCNEYPKFSACARVLSLADDKRFEVFTSPLSLAIGAYYSEKKFRNTVRGKKLTREKIALLTKKLHITTMNESVVERTMANSKVSDLEDGFQHYSAVDMKCTCIVSYDKRDFHFSDIEVLNAEQFLLKHVVGR